MERGTWSCATHEATRGDLAQGSALGVQLNTGGVFGLPVEVFRRYFQGFGVVYR